MNNLISVTVDAIYLDPKQEVKLAKKFWNKYQVSGTYHRGGDHYSSWTLTGTAKTIKKCIEKEWGSDFEDIIEDEDELFILAN